MGLGHCGFEDVEETSDREDCSLQSSQGAQSERAGKGLESCPEHGHTLNDLTCFHWGHPLKVCSHIKGPTSS